MPARATRSFGPNAGLVEEMYRPFLENPSRFARSWRDFFADYQPRGAASDGAPAPAATAAPRRRRRRRPRPRSRPLRPRLRHRRPAPPASRPAPAPAPAKADRARPRHRGGPAATATTDSDRCGARCRAHRRRTWRPASPSRRRRRCAGRPGQAARGQPPDRQQPPQPRSEAGRSLHAPHRLRGRAGVETCRRMNSATSTSTASPPSSATSTSNLGLAVDVTKSDGSRTLIVPNIKNADTLDFAGVPAAYEELIRKARDDKLAADDFAGTTVTLTNPGTIGTVALGPPPHARPGPIIGVGAIDYPAEYEGADPTRSPELGVSKVVTLTCTYDHRIIQGAESRRVPRRRCTSSCSARTASTTRSSRSLDVPYEPVALAARPQPATTSERRAPRSRSSVQHAHQHVPGARPPHRRPRPARPPSRRTCTPSSTRPPTASRSGTSTASSSTGGLAGQAAHDARATSSACCATRTAARSASSTCTSRSPSRSAGSRSRSRASHRRSARGAAPHPRRASTPPRPSSASCTPSTSGHKRFGLEGAETLIPMLDALARRGGRRRLDEVVIGMAHRGRLNVLANIVGKSYEQIFREFEGDLDPATVQGSGDVKYHLGAIGQVTPRPRATTIAADASPPTRATSRPSTRSSRAWRGRKQDQLGDDGTELPGAAASCIHGDAAFAGQGVVAETLNLSAAAAATDLAARSTSSSTTRSASPPPPRGPLVGLRRPTWPRWSRRRSST